MPLEDKAMPSIFLSVKLSKGLRNHRHNCVTNCVFSLLSLKPNSVDFCHIEKSLIFEPAVAKFE